MESEFKYPGNVTGPRPQITDGIRVALSAFFGKFEHRKKFIEVGGGRVKHIPLSSEYEPREEYCGESLFAYMISYFGAQKVGFKYGCV